MTAREIKQRLFELQDVKFREFHSRLIPNIDPATVIGVRTPELRRLAKEIGEDEGFLRRCRMNTTRRISCTPSS